MYRKRKKNKKKNSKKDKKEKVNGTEVYRIAELSILTYFFLFKA